LKTAIVGAVEIMTISSGCWNLLLITALITSANAIFADYISSGFFRGLLVMKNKMLNSALEYQKRGLSVIPVGKNKTPLIQWQKYQNERAGEAQIKNWWKQWPDANIGLITGAISRLAVVDLDEMDIAKEALEPLIPDSLIFPIASTPSGGQHYYFKCPDDKLSNNSRTVTGCDLRANGGFIICPPSTNGNGKAYTWQEGLSIHQVELPPLPQAYLSFIKKHSLYNNIYSFKETVSKLDKTNSQQELTKLTSANKMFQLGTRDNDLFNVANCLVKGGMPRDRIFQVIESIAKNSCNPPFPEKDIHAKFQSALKRSERRDSSITANFKDWVLLTEGEFLLTDANRDLQLLTRAEKQNLYVAADRLCKEGLIEKCGKQRGRYRRIESRVEEIDFMNADSTELKINLPFNIETFVKINPKNIIVVAGSPNAGKTALLLNTADMNMHKHQINYFSSEMAAQELKLRLSKFNRPLKDFKAVKFLERSSDFADVIRPNDINIIDFLEVHEDFWKVGLYIKQIYDKLDKGIAFVAIQKDVHKEHGLGATRGLEKARLYLTMNPGELKIVKAKNWAGPLINPNNFKLKFKLVQGCKFIREGDWKHD
jgi:hypothetical protein